MPLQVTYVLPWSGTADFPTASRNDGIWGFR